jgi:hypothetical protein
MITLRLVHRLINNSVAHPGLSRSKNKTREPGPEEPRAENEGYEDAQAIHDVGRCSLGVGLQVDWRRKRRQ